MSVVAGSPLTLLSVPVLAGPAKGPIVALQRLVFAVTCVPPVTPSSSFLLLPTDPP